MLTESQMKLNSLLESVSDNLDISPSKYQQAVDRYTSVGTWLDADNSPLKSYLPRIFPQGSFRLGTVTRPWRDGREAEFDIDLVCNLAISKKTTPPKVLKEMVGGRLKANQMYQNMLDDEGRRCWKLEYTEDDGIAFHMDILPSLPEDKETIDIYKSHGFEAAKYADKSIAITHTEDQKSYGWVSSNPEGFALWFDEQCRTVPNYPLVRQTAKSRIFSRSESIYARVENVPDLLVRTPLQRVVQILKRHRDVYFSGRSNESCKPISMIITTLAASLYEGEPDLLSALTNIVAKIRNNVVPANDACFEEAHRQVMNKQLIYRDNHGTWQIKNPVNPAENFADRWNEDDSAKAKAFFQWVEALSEHLSEKCLSEPNSSEKISDILLRGNITSEAVTSTRKTGLPSPFDVAHRQHPQWPLALSQKYVVNVRGKWQKNGFRPIELSGQPFTSPLLEKWGNLIYEAQTNVPKPFVVHWQVVNTGDEATKARCLRGEFNSGEVSHSGLRRKEETRYSGMHWIECFIEKNGVCVAKSGEFAINIR